MSSQQQNLNKSNDRPPKKKRSPKKNENGGRHQSAPKANGFGEMPNFLDSNDRNGRNNRNGGGGGYNNRRRQDDRNNGSSQMDEDRSRNDRGAHQDRVNDRGSYVSEHRGSNSRYRSPERNDSSRRSPSRERYEPRADSNEHYRRREYYSPPRSDNVRNDSRFGDYSTSRDRYDDRYPRDYRDNYPRSDYPNPSRDHDRDRYETQSSRSEYRPMDSRRDEPSYSLLTNELASLNLGRSSKKELEMIIRELKEKKRRALFDYEMICDCIVSAEREYQKFRSVREFDELRAERMIELRTFEATGDRARLDGPLVAPRDLSTRSVDLTDEQRRAQAEADVLNWNTAGGRDPSPPRPESLGQRKQSKMEKASRRQLAAMSEEHKRRHEEEQNHDRSDYGGRRGRGGSSAAPTSSVVSSTTSQRNAEDYPSLSSPLAPQDSSSTLSSVSTPTGRSTNQLPWNRPTPVAPPVETSSSASSPPNLSLGSTSSPSKTKVPTTNFAPLQPMQSSNSKAIVVARKAPATTKGKEKVILLTNFWDLQVHNMSVFRYDVEIVGVVAVGGPQQKAIAFTGGPRDDSARSERQNLCISALRTALEAYNVFNNMAGMIYDGACLLYTSEDIGAVIKGNNGVFEVTVGQLPEEVRRFIRRPDIDRLEVRLQPNSISPQFETGDFSNETNRDMAQLDRTRKNFLDLLTSQNAIIRSGFTVFGAGKVYDMHTHGRNIGNGHESRDGADKGIKFIEGGISNKKKSVDVVPSLTLDAKVGMFFKEQSIEKSLRELLGSLTFRFNKDGRDRITDPNWIRANKYVKGLRLVTHDSQSTFVAAGLSKEPISKLTNNDETMNSSTDTTSTRLPKVYVIEKFQQKTGMKFDGRLPAIVVKLSKKSDNTVKEMYFPIEYLQVAPNQRVSIAKQESAPEKALRPQDRWDRIQNSLKALNLHEGGRYNEFLSLFGIELSLTPKRVEGIRREAPKVVYSKNGKIESHLDKDKHNWRVPAGARPVRIGHAKIVFVAHTCPDRVAEDAIRALKTKCDSFGLRVDRWERKKLSGQPNAPPQQIEEQIHTQLSKIFEGLKKEDGAMILFIDESKRKLHDQLKLLERKHLVLTQQVTTENATFFLKRPKTVENVVSKMNCKLGGLNYEVVPEVFAKEKWLSTNKVMIVGYDVAHPTKAPRDEFISKKPPTVPSVVGFSFNGGIHPEAFIGDYHYQAPRCEQVDDVVLNKRMKWMLGLFLKNRRNWPEEIVIVRDGVSEGQYRMAMTEEMEAIREACREFGNINGKPDWEPKMAMTIVTKRHSARLFKEGHNGRVENVKPGTVVDTDIVRPQMNEMYMVSSHAIQGVAKPACYQLLIDDGIFPTMDEFESLMSALTFTHQIVESPIGIPEPVYQADEWAKRGNNMWKVYDTYFTLPRLAEKGEYSENPVDFEAMTNRLAFWTTKLENQRVNA